MRAPGIPQVQANGFAEYKSPMGWGIGVGPQFIGRQDANDQGTLHIPGEIEYDGFVFYGMRRWDVRVNVKNIINKRLLDPIAVSFAGNDTIARKIVDVASQIGVRIPDDLSVIGFDDSPAARMQEPLLTTIHQPLKEVGALAASILIDLINGKTRPVTRHLFRPALVIRATTSAPRG